MSEGRHYFFGGMMFMLGLTVGIGAGFLLAPRSGRDTRRQIKGLADETGTHLGRIADETKQVFSGVVKHGKELAKETGGHLDNITQEAKQTANQIAAHGKQIAKETGGHLENITKEARQTADQIAAHGKELMRDSA